MQRSAAGVKVRLTIMVEATAMTEPVPMEMSIGIGKNRQALKQNNSVAPETSTVWPANIIMRWTLTSRWNTEGVQGKYKLTVYFNPYLPKYKF